MKTKALYGQRAAEVAVIAIMLMTLPAVAEEIPLMAGIRMAFQVPTKKASREGMESFIGGGADLGLSFKKHLDLTGEVEYIHGRNDNTFAVYDPQGNILDSGVLNESAFSGLFSLRWRLWNAATPYVGLGAGGSRLTWTVAGYKESANAPVMEALTGYEFASSEHFRLDLDLRFRSQRADVDWGGVPNDISGIQFSVESHYNW